MTVQEEISMKLFSLRDLCMLLIAGVLVMAIAGVGYAGSKPEEEKTP